MIEAYKSEVLPLWGNGRRFNPIGVNNNKCIFRIFRFCFPFATKHPIIMPRKSKRQREFEEKKQTIYQASDELGQPYEEDRLFAILCVCGYPAAKAYRLAYPHSQASVSSSAVLASRRLKEPAVQEILNAIGGSYWCGLIYLKDGIIKERWRRWPSYCPPRKDRIEPDEK